MTLEAGLNLVWGEIRKIVICKRDRVLQTPRCHGSTGFVEDMVLFSGCIELRAHSYLALFMCQDLTFAVSFNPYNSFMK